MARLPEWEVTFLKAEDGSDPFGAFVSSLPVPARIEWEALIRLLQKHGDTLHGTRVLLHNDRLWEFQGEDVRIFYKRGLRENQVIVIAGLRRTDGEELLTPILRKGKSV